MRDLWTVERRSENKAGAPFWDSLWRHNGKPVVFQSSGDAEMAMLGYLSECRAAGRDPGVVRLEYNGWGESGRFADLAKVGGPGDGVLTMFVCRSCGDDELAAAPVAPVCPCCRKAMDTESFWVRRAVA